MLTHISLDTLMNGSTNWFFKLMIGFFFKNVFPAMWLIISAPFTDPTMMWIVTPLLISMVLMQLYFARNRDEELGWSSAFGNSISLIFVSINLMQVLFNRYGWAGLNIFNPITSKIYLIAGIAFISIIQLIINYLHLIPKKIAFFVNSSIPTNMTAYIAITLVYTDTPFDVSTLIAAFFLLAILIYLFKYLKGLIPMSKEAVYYTQMMKEKSEREQSEREKVELRQERAADAKLVDAVIAIAVVIGLFFTIMVLKSFFFLPYSTSLLIQGVVYVIATIILLLARNLSLFNLNFDGELFEHLIGVVLGFFLLLVVTGLVYVLWFFLPVNDRMELLVLTYDYLNAEPWFLFGVIGVLVPIGAELLFRGVILRSLKPKLGKHSSILLQAFLFSLVTFSFSILNGISSPFMLLSIPVLFTAAVLLGYMRDKWGLESAIMAHVTVNIIGGFLYLITI